MTLQITTKLHLRLLWQVSHDPAEDFNVSGTVQESGNLHSIQIQRYIGETNETGHLAGLLFKEVFRIVPR